MPEDSIRQMISFAIKSCRPHFSKLAGKHNKDESADMVAGKIVEHIRRSGYDVVRVREPAAPHSTHPSKRC